MNDLIKVNYSNDRQTTSARDLWEFLDRPYTEFTKWFNHYKEYGFIENIDFRVIERFVDDVTAFGGKRKLMDCEMTLDMGKELAMLQKTEKGKQARKYFIAVQKAWNSPEQVMARALQIANVKMLDYQNKVIELSGKIEILTHSNKLYTTTEIAKELGYRSATVFNKELEKRKIQYKINRTWVLTANHSEKGYVSIKQNVLENGKVVYDRKWTETGRQFLLEIFGKEEIA